MLVFGGSQRFHAVFHWRYFLQCQGSTTHTACRKQGIATILTDTHSPALLIRQSLFRNRLPVVRILAGYALNDGANCSLQHSLFLVVFLTGGKNGRAWRATKETSGYNPASLTCPTPVSLSRYYEK